MEYDGIELHGVAETVTVDGRDGVLLQRVPESVRRHLNPGARREMRRPGGTEIRIVPEGRVEVTLSAPGDPALIVPFWGPLQKDERIEVGSEPTTVSIDHPEFFDQLEPSVAEEFAFDPLVCRFRATGGPIHLHDVDGDRRPPRREEVPETRYLAYGTSITYGVAATGPHLTYPALVARRLGLDAINLGSSGTAFCEPELAEYVAARDDWDVASLGLSVNMIEDFTVEEFEDRASYYVETVAATGRPAVAITLFPFHPDVLAGADPARARAFRETLREIVREAPQNVRLLEGPELLDPAGLTTDVIHPGDHGMAQIAAGLADELAEFV